MAKKKYKPNTLFYIPPGEIELHPDFPNIRGPVRDTTDLQQSIKQRGGVEKPLELWEGPDGTLYVIDGHRRRTAAIAVGLDTIPCIIKQVLPEEIVDLMLVADMQKSLPHIAHDSAGHVIGGVAWAVNYRLSGGKMKKYQLGQVMGLPPDTVSAYAALFKDILPIRKRVEAGNLDITVYALIKRQTIQFKEYLLEKKPGKITADYVRRLKKDWDRVQVQLGENDEFEFDDEKHEEGLEPEGRMMSNDISQPEEFTVARCLNEALNWLHRVDGRVLGKTDYVILDRVEESLAVIKGV